MRKMFRIIEVDQAQTWDNIVSTFHKQMSFILINTLGACQLRAKVNHFCFIMRTQKPGDKCSDAARYLRHTAFQ